MKLLWIEGSLYRMIHFTPHALRVLERARDGFRLLKTPGEFALVSLEMAITMVDEKDFEALEKLRRNTVDGVEELTRDPIFLEIMGKWNVKSSVNSLLEIKQAIHDLEL